MRESKTFDKTYRLRIGSLYQTMKYQIKTPRETYTLEADGKNNLRKLILEKENIIFEESQQFDKSLYYQRSVRYKGKTLGNSTTSMQNYGCALMCFSYIFRKDPLEVNQLFIDKGVYSGDMIIFSKAVDILGGKNYKKVENINNMPTQEETIKEVQLGKSQHFTVRLNKDGKRYIFDPWTGDFQTLNLYPFKSYRVFDL